MGKNENEIITKSIPIAPLKIIALDGLKEMSDKINEHIVSIRQERAAELIGNTIYFEKETDNYLVHALTPRFGTGEGKGMISETIRGKDLFIMGDVTNDSISYQIHGKNTIKSPDDHFQDIKRIIAAASGKAHRISLIMPFMYEGRQHRRYGRESLDCAVALQELAHMGVSNIITFDVHDPRVQNAIPIQGFDNFYTTLQFIRTILETEKKFICNRDHLMLISPDEGGMTRSMYYSNVLGIDIGMFYKRRDFSVVINGKNPIAAHEFLGSSVKNKDVLIVDDMIASGESVLDIAKSLKEKGAGRVFIAATFGLFTEGFERFDEYYEKGYINRIYTTNLVYASPELTKRSYYQTVDISKYIALIIDTLNHDVSISKIVDPTSRIKELLENHSCF